MLGLLFSSSIICPPPALLVLAPHVKTISRLKSLWVGRVGERPCLVYRDSRGKHLSIVAVVASSLPRLSSTLSQAGSQREHSSLKGIRH